MRMLQVCNVGRITGGTAACAWTIARAFPDVEQHVAFLSPPCDATRRAFSGCSLHTWKRVDARDAARIDADVLVLHNIAPQQAGTLRAPTMQYVHSRGTRAKADVTLYCSAWLAAECGRGSDARVLYQPVPKPPAPVDGERRSLRERMRVGRLCTPTARKWPEDIDGFYQRLARRFPEVDWEFVGCPPEMQGRLNEACAGRGTFIPASWSARSRLWTWDALLYHHPQLTESFGRTAAESMRAGCIPIVDRRGGFTEQIADGTGFLCEHEDGFCEVLQSLSDPNVRLRMSRAAMAHADQTFSLQRFRSDLLRLLAAFGANVARQRASLAGAAG